MKKLMSILLAVLMVCTLACAAALADEVPQPEGGKKFEGDWARRGAIVQIVYEEEGYRVYINIRNNEDNSGKIWEYSCYYVEDQDALVSVSSVCHPYTWNPETDEYTDGENEYEELDEAGKESSFTIAENGGLFWNDGHAPGTTTELEFRSIGRFEGTWRSAEGEEPVWVDFTWEGLKEEDFFYTVYLHRGDNTTYAEFTMTGTYDETTGKLSCTGKSVDAADTEEYEAFFSMTENGQLLYEAANGILLNYDPIRENNG